MKNYQSKRWLQLLGIILSLFMLVSITSPTSAQTIDFIDGIGLDYGRGFDMLKLQSSPRIPITDRRHNVLPGGQRAEFELVELTSSLDLDEALDLDISGGASVILFSSSAKASYLRRHKMNRYNLYYMVKVVVTNREELLTYDPRLTAEAKNLLTGSSGLDLFYQTYGTHFVYGILSGGEYFGIIEIETTSEMDRQEVAAQIKSGGIGWSFRSKFAQKINSVSRTHKVKVHEIAIGGVGFTPSNSVSGLFNTAEGFPNKVLQNPVPIKVTLAPYTVFSEYASVFTDLDLDRRYALLDISLNYLDYMYLQNHLDYISSNPNQFRFRENTKSNDLNSMRLKSRDIEYKLTELEHMRNQVVNRSQPIPQMSQTANQFASQIMLPRLYKGFVANMKPILNVTEKSLYPLNGPTRGDSEMSGNRPKIYVNASLVLENSGQRVRLRYYTKMVEGKSNWTTFESSANKIWKFIGGDDHLPQGFRIQTVYPFSGSIYAQAGSDDHSWHWYTGSGLLSRAWCRSDVSGKETGKIGCSKIEFNPVKVTLRHEEDYLNQPIVYDPASQREMQILMHTPKKPAKLQLKQKIIPFNQFKREIKLPKKKVIQLKKVQ